MTQEELSKFIEVINELNKQARSDYEKSNSLMEKQFYLGKSCGFSQTTLQIINLFTDLDGEFRKAEKK